jgi:hypothetical protein
MFRRVQSISSDKLKNYAPLSNSLYISICHLSHYMLCLYVILFPLPPNRSAPNRKLLMNMLKRIGYDVASAENGQICIELFTHHASNRRPKSQPSPVQMNRHIQLHHQQQQQLPQPPAAISPNSSLLSPPHHQQHVATANDQWPFGLVLMDGKFIAAYTILLQFSLIS